MLPHFCFIISFSVRTFFETLTPAGELVVIEFDAESWFVRDADATFDNWHAATEDDFVFLGLPGIVRVARVGQVWSGCGDVGHGHQ